MIGHAYAGYCGWVDWVGGDASPVPVGLQFQVHFENGTFETRRETGESDHVWSHSESRHGYNIVAYRVEAAPKELRDEFAAAALSSLYVAGRAQSVESRARAAYELADAMMKERMKS